MPAGPSLRSADRVHRAAGVEAGFAAAVAREVGRPLRVVETPWPNLVDALLDDRIDSDLLGKVNAALAKLEASGEADAILSRWMPMPAAVPEAAGRRDGSDVGQETQTERKQR